MMRRTAYPFRDHPTVADLDMRDALPGETPSGPLFMLGTSLDCLSRFAVSGFGGAMMFDRPRAVALIRVLTDGVAWIDGHDPSRNLPAGQGGDA